MILTENNYYSSEANNEYLSASQIKNYLNCESSALAESTGEYQRPTTSALMIGQYVDNALTGDLEAFKAEHPEILKKDGTLKADFVLAEQMIEKATGDPVFMDYLTGEYQKIVTGEIGGIPFRAKLDVYREGYRIVDLKTVRDMNPVYVPGQGRVDFATAWRWTLQLAIYQELVRQNTWKTLPVYLAVITKETPCDIQVIHVPQHILDAELEALELILPRIDGIRKGIIPPHRCGHCAYCRQTHKLTGSVSLDELNDENDGGLENE